MMVYKITNKVNGKIYIGQTINDLESRWKEHCKSGFALHSAIIKYGRKNFDRQILEECSSLEELNFLEDYYINFHNSMSPNGYNLRRGGDNKTFCEESKIKRIKAFGAYKEFIAVDIFSKQEKIFFTQCEASKELKIAKCSVNLCLHKKTKACFNWVFIFKDDLENKEKIIQDGIDSKNNSDKRKLKSSRQQNVRGLKVINLKTKEETVYLTVKAATLDGFHSSMIYAVLNGKSKYHKGCTFEKL